MWCTEHVDMFEAVRDAQKVQLPMVVSVAMAGTGTGCNELVSGEVQAPLRNIHYREWESQKPYQECGTRWEHEDGSE